MKSLLISILSFSLWAGEEHPFLKGMDAYREGRFQEALEAFVQAEAAAGEDASPELLYNKAMSALRAGEIEQVESTVEKAAARGGNEFSALRDFLYGNVAFERCLKAQEKASQPGAEPTSFDAAISQAQAAKQFWELAAMSRPDWPEARRNVERVVKKLEELKKQKEEAEKKKNEEKKDQKKDEESKDEEKKPDENSKKEDSQEKKEDQAPKEQEPKSEQTPEQKEDSEKSQQAQAQPQAIEVSPEEMKQLFEKLDEKEKEKQQLRKTLHRTRKAKVEKDW